MPIFLLALLKSSLRAAPLLFDTGADDNDDEEEDEEEAEEDDSEA